VRRAPWRRDLVDRERLLAPLQHEHADRRAAADQRYADEHRVLLLAEAGHVLVGRLGRGVRRRDRSHALGDEAGDALADVEHRGPDRGAREAVVAAHHEPVVLARVDTRDLDARDRGDLVTSRSTSIQAARRSGGSINRKMPSPRSPGDEPEPTTWASCPT
jgi:hypothetical protein